MEYTIDTFLQTSKISFMLKIMIAESSMDLYVYFGCSYELSSNL